MKRPQQNYSQLLTKGLLESQFIKKTNLNPARFLKDCVKCLHEKHAVCDFASEQPIHSG
jgi:hypothetical protein